MTVLNVLLVKMFNVKDNGNIAVVRENCDLPFIGKIIECRGEKFVSKLSESQKKNFEN